MREITYMEAAREGLAEEMKRDPTVFVVGEGIGARGGNYNTTTGLYDIYGPERLRDTPITERGFTTLCTGAALAGARPVVDFMIFDFILDAMGDLVNQMSRMQWLSGGRLKMPIVLRGCCGVFSSAGAHHSGTFYPFFMHVPGFRVVAPATPRDGKGLLKTAIRSDDPVFFLEHRAIISMKGPVPEEEYLIPFGKAQVVREGSDVTVVAFAWMVHKALEAAAVLEAEGISAEVVDLRSLAPLDMETVRTSVAKTGRLLVVDEDYSPCGVGAEIAAQVADASFGDLDAPVRWSNGAFVPAPYSPALEKAVLVHTDAIVAAVRDLRAE